MSDEVVGQRPTTALMLGRMEGRLEALELRMSRSEDTTAERMAAMEAKLDKLQQTLSQGLGGMRVAHWVGGVVLALGGFLTSHLWTHGE
jgi:hypothetical protein